jgi:hypothetical protein
VRHTSGIAALTLHFVGALVHIGSTGEKALAAASLPYCVLTALDDRALAE